MQSRVCNGTVQILASYQPDDVQFHDRCVVCTAALAIYLGYSFSPFLAGEFERVQKEGIYQNRVFFIHSLGFITPRRVLLDDQGRNHQGREDDRQDDSRRRASFH